MQSTWIFGVCLLLYTSKVVNSSFPCKKDEYIIVNGSTPCLQCNECVYGSGLHPPCGSTLDHPPQIECLRCKPGITYSDEHGPSSCKACHRCSNSHEIITKKCTPESNTICSNTCELRYYYENTTHGCEPCSYCCDDDNDIRIEACKTLTKQCSIHNAQRCTPTIITSTIYSTLVTTTNNTASTSKHSVGMTVGFSLSGSLAAIIFIIVLVYCYKKRREERPQANNLQKRDVENGAAIQPLTTCGIEKINFCLKIAGYNEPDTHTKRLLEGDNLTLSLNTCENENQLVDNDCSKHSTFDWTKDGLPLNDCEQRELKRNAMKVGDSGKFQCHMHCQTHQTDKHSDEMVIHIQPGQGKRLKCFNEIGYDMETKLATLLKPNIPGVGNWQNVGRHYGMDADTLKSFEDDSSKVEQVIAHLHATNPDLTVFDFCEFLKTIKQFQIVKALISDLTVEEKAQNIPNAPLNESRDSGFEFEDYLQVALPDLKSSAAVSVHKSEKPSDHFMRGQLVNPSYCDSSREGSLDELPISIIFHSKHDNDNTNDQGNEGKASKKKRISFCRQASKDSQKSTGSEKAGKERSRSVSLSSIKDAVKDRFNGKVQHDYLEHREEDTEDDEV